MPSMRKRKVKRLMIWLLMMPFLFCWPVHPVYAGTQLVIHYHRDDGDYGKWNIWSWAEGKDGAAYPFTGEDAFGAYAEITLPQDTSKAGFIVRTDSWEKDVGDDRFIDVSLGSEIWVYTATPDFSYDAPEGYAEEASPIPQLALTLHYNRYDGAYEGIFATVDGGETPPVLAAPPDRHDSFGAVFTFNMEGLTSKDKLKINLQGGDEKLEEFTVSLRNVETDTLEVYYVNGSREQNFAQITSLLQIDIDAVLDAPNTVNIALSYPLAVPEDVTAQSAGFMVFDQTDGVSVPISETVAVNAGANDGVYGKLTPGFATAFTLTFEEDLPLDHTLTVAGFGAEPAEISLGKVYASERFEEIFTYTGDDLGATYTPESTTFRLWAPVASSVDLLLDGDSVYAMEKDQNGTWVYCAEGDLNGVPYNFTVTNYGKQSTLVDPYAKAVGVNGKTGVVVDLNQTDPAGWDNDRRPTLENPTDAVIYELHVRDFSTHPSSGMTNAGKFLAFTETGTTTPDGQKTGVDHLKELGITHVHLLPVFDYASLDESKTDAAAFNWGYDPLNYNAPEGTYATDPFTAEVRVNEFKQMVQSLHDNGIGVIMDVVYNHTGPTADSNLNLAVPYYYYRMNANGTFSNGSSCGNETASERSMVRKLIVDSVAYWAKEYHLDGFRFDLMGLHDVDTMNAVREALDEIDPAILMYGEGWAGGTSPLPSSKAALKANMVALDSRIAAFSDDIRDGIKGSVFNAADPGYVSSYYGRKEQIKFGAVGSVPHPQVETSRLANSKNFWAKSPTQTITYASAHDNLTLWDKLLASTPNATEDEHLAMNRLSAAMVLTSQGIPFLHAGEEIARTKNGDDNSYKSSDLINQIKWDTKTERRSLFDYYAGLIALRKAHPAFRMTETPEVQANIEFLDTEAQITAYTLNNHANGDTEETLLVAFNVDKAERELKLPKAGWAVLVDGERAGTETLAQIGSDTLVMHPRSAYVLAYNGLVDSARPEIPAEIIAAEENPTATATVTETASAPRLTTLAIGIGIVALAAVSTVLALVVTKRKKKQ